MGKGQKAAASPMMYQQAMPDAEAAAQPTPGAAAATMFGKWMHGGGGATDRPGGLAPMGRGTWTPDDLDEQETIDAMSRVGMGTFGNHPIGALAGFIGDMLSDAPTDSPMPSSRPGGFSGSRGGNGTQGGSDGGGMSRGGGGFGEASHGPGGRGGPRF